MLFAPAEVAAAGPKCPGYESDPRSQVVGSASADVLEGTPDDDVICGLGGWDTITGLGGDDLILGESGPGFDPVSTFQTWARDDGDTLVGGPGRDVIWGGPDGDLIWGDAKPSPSLPGVGDLSSSDELHGDSGSDTIEGGPGPDLVSGGEGYTDFHPPALDPLMTAWQVETDATYYWERDVPMSLTIDGLPNDGAPGEGDNILTDIEGIMGGRGADLVLGSSNGRENLSGYWGDDLVSGNGGRNDWVGGSSGRDVLDIRDAEPGSPAGEEFGPGIALADLDDQYWCDDGKNDIALVDWNDAQVGMASSRPDGRPSKIPGSPGLDDPNCAFEEPTADLLGTSGRSASVLLSCEGSRRACKGKVVLSTKGRRLGARAYRIKPGGRRALKVRLVRRGPKLLRSGRGAIRLKGNTQMADGFLHRVRLRG